MTLIQVFIEFFLSGGRLLDEFAAIVASELTQY